MAASLARINDGLFRLLRWRRRRPRRCAPTAAESRCGYEVSRRRAEAMRALFPKLTAWHAPPGYLDEVTAIDRELREAVSLDDLRSCLGAIERSRAARAN